MALGIQPVVLMNEASFALLIQTPCRPGQSKPKFDAYKLNHKYLGIQSHHTVTPYNVRSTLQHRQQVFVYRLLRVRVGELGRIPNRDFQIGTLERLVACESQTRHRAHTRCRRNHLAG